MIERIYSVDQAAIILNVSDHTIRAWYHQRRLKGIKLGRRVMFSEEELQRFIDQGKQLDRTGI